MHEQPNNIISTHGTRKHLINFYNLRATPQLAEVEN
jgi:hypothetical protein